MKNHYQKKYTKVIVSFLLILTMLTAFVPAGVFADNSTVTHLAFTSDVHNIPAGQTYGNVSADRLKNWLQGVSLAKGDIQFDALGITGDIGSALHGSNTYWSSVGAAIDAVENSGKVINGAYTYGNHDALDPGNARTPLSDYEKYSAKYTQSGEALKTDSYIIYGLGANNVANNSFQQNDIDKLSAYLDQCERNETEIPLFIISHYPLHNYAGRNITNASKVIALLNSHKDMDITFLWGHNHTESDPHYCKIYTEDLDGTGINFTYASAGCMCDYEYHNGQGANTKGKGLTVDINTDGSLTYSYYDKNNNSLGTTVVKNDVAEEAEIEGKTNYETYPLEAGRTYVIAANGHALTNVPHNGYEVNNSNGNYQYSGLAGKEITTAGKYIVDFDPNGNDPVITQDMLWTAEALDGGFAFKNADGNYLAANYQQNTGGYQSIGALECADAPFAWVQDGSKLKCKSLSRYLAFDLENGDIDGTIKEQGTADLFTIRGSNRGDEISFYTDPDAEIKQPFEISNAFEDRETYLIVVDKKVLSCENKHAGYTTTNDFHYAGFEGMDFYEEMLEEPQNVIPYCLWKAEKAEGYDHSFALKNVKTGSYLNATYNDQNGAPKGGSIYMDSVPQLWHMTDGGLQHIGTGKILNFDKNTDIKPESGTSHLFTVRSKGTKPSLYKAPYIPNEDALCQVEQFEDQASFVIIREGHALTTLENSGYIVTNGSNNENEYHYSGFDGQRVNYQQKEIETTTIEPIIVWHAEKYGNGFALYVGEGTDKQYLNASYEPNGKGDGKDGKIYLGNSQETWILENGALKHESTGKYLNFETEEDITGDHSGGNVDLFTIRSNYTDSERDNDENVYIYRVGEEIEVKEQDYLGKEYYEATKVTGSISTGNYMIISKDNRCLTSRYHDGYRYNNDNAMHYYGLYGQLVEINSENKVVSPIDASMVWSIEKQSSKYTLKSFSTQKYLYSAYLNDKNGWGYIAFQDDAYKWTLDGKRLKDDKYINGDKYIMDQTTESHIIAGGSGTNLFTMRSSGTEFDFYKVEKEDCIDIKYVAGEGGKVSRSRDIKNSTASTIKGSTAIPDPGYTFVGWMKGDESYSTDTTITPDKSGTYIAVFKENGATINYVVKGEGEISLNNDPFEYDKTDKTESIEKAVTEGAKGAIARIKNGSKFIGWSTDEDGTNIISTEAEFTPVGPFISEDGGNVITYYAQFVSCYGYIKSELTQGHANLLFGEYEFKDFILDHLSNAWTIFDTAQDQYVGVIDGKLVYQDDFYLWQYDGGFYTQGKRSAGRQLLSLIKSLLNISEKEPAKYYLTAEPGRLTVSTEPQEVIFFMQFANRDHKTVEGADWSTKNDENHFRICPDCGKMVETEHDREGENGSCSVCGYDHVLGRVTKVNVVASTEVDNQRILMLNVPIRRNKVVILADTENVMVDKIEYRTSILSQWKTGSTYISLFGIRNLYIRVTDANDHVTNWHYDGNSTQQID